MKVTQKCQAPFYNSRGGVTFAAPSKNDPSKFDVFSKEIIAVLYAYGSAEFTASDNTRVTVMPDEILLHELTTHAIPLAVRFSNSTSLRRENKIRAELGLVRRPADSTHRR